MARMLGFSDEDKQRVGVAQQGAGKGVVRGVLGLPGRFVGGILGSSAPEEAHSATASDQVISCQQPYTILSLFLTFSPSVHVQISLLCFFTEFAGIICYRIYIIFWH